MLLTTDLFLTVAWPNWCGWAPLHQTDRLTEPEEVFTGPREAILQLLRKLGSKVVAHTHTRKVVCTRSKMIDSDLSRPVCRLDFH